MQAMLHGWSGEVVGLVRRSVALCVEANAPGFEV